MWKSLFFLYCLHFLKLLEFLILFNIFNIEWGSPLVHVIKWFLFLYLILIFKFIVPACIYSLCITTCLVNTNHLCVYRFSKISVVSSFSRMIQSFRIFIHWVLRKIMLILICYQGFSYSHSNDGHVLRSGSFQILMRDWLFKILILSIFII